VRELLSIKDSAVNTCSLLKCQTTKVKLIPNLIAAVENNERVLLTEFILTTHCIGPFLKKRITFYSNKRIRSFPTCTCRIIVNGYLRNLRIFVIYLPFLTDHDYSCKEVWQGLFPRINEFQKSGQKS